MKKDVSPEYLRENRGTPSVLKAKLSTFRERHPCNLVVVLEGPDDLVVYEIWLERLAPGIEWEPLVANGKKKSLDFYDIVMRDTTGIGTCTYFIVDHDYDGIRGRSRSEKVYVLPAYSIENFLVDNQVVESILRTDLRALAEPDVRAEILRIYTNLRTQFIAELQKVGIILYGARNEKVGNVVVDESVMACFSLTLDGLNVVNQEKLDALVRTEQAVSKEGMASGEEFMSCNDGALWTRGKYLFSFYRAFLNLIYADRRSDEPRFFAERLANPRENPSAFDLGLLASRSPLPAGLREAIARWDRECESECRAA